MSVVLNDEDEDFLLSCWLNPSVNHVLGWFEGQLHWIVDVNLKNEDKDFLFSPVG